MGVGVPLRTVLGLTGTGVGKWLYQPPSAPVNVGKAVAVRSAGAAQRVEVAAGCAWIGSTIGRFIFAIKTTVVPTTSRTITGNVVLPIIAK